MYALDALSGDVRWTAKIGSTDPIFSSPAVGNGLVYIGSTDGFTYALKAGDGSEAWSTFTPFQVNASAPAVTNRVVYIGTNDHVLHALDALSGATRWRFEANSIIGSSPTVANGVVYVGDESGLFHVLDARTGDSLKTIDTGDGRIITSSSPVVVNGVVYIGSSIFFPEISGRLHAFGLRQ
jgi:outer membrane protein assembly factor BamB